MRWVAFLRAINIGNRRVTGDRLVAVFQSLGFQDVANFQASGNVLFTAAAAERSLIEHALEAELGYPVPTALRSGGDIETIVSAEPFSDDQLAATEGRVQVMILRDRMPDAVRVSGLADVPSDDLLVLRTSEVFWLPREGISGSRLKVGAVEQAIGTMTIRTLATVQRIHARL